MIKEKKYSYWDTQKSHLPGHMGKGIPLEKYCIPFDAALVICDLADFTCKDVPLMAEQRRSILEIENSPPLEEGYEIRSDEIIRLLGHIHQNRNDYCPMVGTKKWKYYPYKKLYFYRKDKYTFYIIGNMFGFPISTQMILTNDYTE